MEAEPLADKKSECAAKADGMADDGAQRQEKPRKRIRKKVSDPEKERLFLSAMSRILQVTGVETQASLADVLGVQQSSISDAKRRNSIPAQWYMTLLTKRGINPAWVVSGVGPRHVLGPCAELGTHRQADAASARAGEGTDATEGTMASPVLVRVYSTRCPVLAAEAASSLPVAGELAVPSGWASASVMTLLLEADAWLPFFPKGSYVGVDTACTQPLPGEYYGIFLAGLGVTIAPITADPLRGCYMAERNDSRMECPLTNILGRVVWCWRAF